MKTATIVSGNFTTGKDRKGNFSGYTATGARFFIHKAQMEGIGMSKQAEVKFPLYCVVQTRTFDLVDADGNVTEKNGIVRDQATAIFPDRDDLIAAMNSEATIQILAAKDLRKIVDESGLSQEDVNALVSMSL